MYLTFLLFLKNMNKTIPKVVKVITVGAFIGSALNIIIENNFFHKLDYYNQARIFNQKNSAFRSSNNEHEKTAFKLSTKVVQNCPFNKSCIKDYKAFRSFLNQKHNLN